MIRCYPTVNDLAHEFCVWFEEVVEKVLRSKSLISIAVSGGNTPALFFDELAVSDKIPWNRLQIYWVDERCVAPDHADSNYGMTVKHLFEKISMSPDRIHRIVGENDPQHEAKRYAAEMVANVKNKNKIPAFDLILLGVGADGHTASLFPDRPDLLNSMDICAVVKHPQSGQNRITLTGKVILNASKLAFLTSGSSKKEILKEIFNEPVTETICPAAYINHNYSDAYWFVDYDAAESLNHMCHD